MGSDADVVAWDLHRGNGRTNIGEINGVYIDTAALTIECSVADRACILDGEDDHRVVDVSDVLQVITTINFIGLKITRGLSGYGGAGMRISSATTITNCLISDNDAATELSVSNHGEVCI